MINGLGGNYASMYMYQQEPISSQTVQNGDEENNEDVTANELDKDKQKEEINKQEQNKTDETLTLEEENVVNKLKDRDTEVKQHEAQHMAVGGGLVRGGMRLDYSTGPDGQSYAVGGEVSIDISTGSTPEETQSKMQQIKSAALAPSEPSGQDYAVASQATAMEMDALREATAQKTEEQDKENKKTDDKKVEDKKSLDKKEDDKKEDNINDIKNSNVDESNSLMQSIDIFA